MRVRAVYAAHSHHDVNLRVCGAYVAGRPRHFGMCNAASVCNIIIHRMCVYTFIMRIITRAAAAVAAATVYKGRYT